MHVRNFADRKCGGKRNALRLARTYRNELIRRTSPLSRKEFSAIRRRNNRTGVVGVCRYSKSYRLKDGTVRHSWYWEAIWPTTPGKSEIVRFSVNKLGEAGAFNRACAARLRGFKQIEGVFWPKSFNFMGFSVWRTFFPMSETIFPAWETRFP